MRTGSQSFPALLAEGVASSVIPASVALSGCSASNSDGPSGRASGGSGASSASGGSAGAPPPSNNGGTGNTLVIGDPAGGTAGSVAQGGGESCATQTADAAITRLPVDIIVVID